MNRKAHLLTNFDHMRFARRTKQSNRNIKHNIGGSGAWGVFIYMRSPHVPVNLLVSFIYLNIRQQYCGSRYSIIVKRVEFSVE